MNGMNQYLAEQYGTVQQSGAQNGAEDAEKIAQAQLFAKVAAEHNIDLEQLNDQQVADLWNTVFSSNTTKTAAEHGHKKDEHKEKEGAAKTASEHGHKEKDEHKEKDAAARQEFLEKQAWEQKCAEADFLGRKMAHAYVAELREIAAASNGTASGEDKTAAMPPQLAKALSAAKGHAGKAGDKLKEVAGKAKEHVKKHKTEYAAGAGGAAAGAAGGYAAGKKKKASALDEKAMEIAIFKVAEAGLDPEEAASKLSALLTLGVPEETKVAYAKVDYDTSLGIRALELLEAVGYPVQWEQQ